ncbi:MAG: LysM peptidoglycan-binding domain-containing protein [Bacteroidales bacterium]|nr:LysM peptidoglycan-binding domain-containing protein [Bacteroidales bacterium]
MRFRLFTLLFLLIAANFTQHAYAQDVIVKRSTVIENYKGKPYYIHFVNKGETLAAIAKAYNVSVEEISADNPVIAQGLKADMVLRIPQKSIVAIPEADTKLKTEIKTEQAKPAEIQKAQSKPADDPNYILYQVKKQETLYGISKQYNVSVDDIINANPGFDGLKDGMEIRIPKKKSIEKASVIVVPSEKDVKAESNPDEVIVKTGETLYSIGKAYNVSVDDLIDLNPQLGGGLKAGMVLKLRKGDAKSGVKSTAKKESEIIGVPVVPVGPALPGDCYKAENVTSTYKVALILPFNLADATEALEAPETKNTSEFENFNYFQFYAGFMLAADSLEKYGLHARIQVLDGDRLNDTLTIKQTLRKPGLDKMDLIVGPMYANSFSVAARFAKKHEIGIINPLSRRENIVDGNPFVLKMQVSGAGVANKLASFIISKYPNATIIAVKNDNKEQKAMLSDFESIIKTGLTSHSFKGSLQEVTYSTDMMAGVAKKLKPHAKNIIIFFSNNKTNVPNFVSLLNPLSKSNDIILIGMDGWEELELETEFLVNLNFHQVTSSYIDYENEAVQQFITRFRNKYGSVPLSAKHAYLGYDIGWYFLTSLMQYGDKYITCLPDYKGTGLQHNFYFSSPVQGKGLQNQDVNIVKLQDYKMIKVE